MPTPGEVIAQRYYESTKKAVSEGLDSVSSFSRDAVSDYTAHMVEEYAAAEVAAKDAVDAARRGSSSDFLAAMDVVGDWYKGTEADVYNIEAELKDIPIDVLFFLVGDYKGTIEEAEEAILGGSGSLLEGINIQIEGVKDVAFGWIEPVLRTISEVLAYCVSWFSERLADLLMIPAEAFFKYLSYILYKEKE